MKRLCVELRTDGASVNSRWSRRFDRRAFALTMKCGQGNADTVKRETGGGGLWG